MTYEQEGQTIIDHEREASKAREARSHEFRMKALDYRPFTHGLFPTVMLLIIAITTCNVVDDDDVQCDRKHYRD